MSYEERLNSFNQAASSANEHVQRIRDTLTNPEMKENPVKMGLNLASQTLGTIGGIARIRKGMQDGSELRKIAEANYNKFGDIKNTLKTLPKNINGATNEVLGRAQASASSQIADTGTSSSTAVQNFLSGKSAPTPSTPNITPQIDRDVSDNIASLGGNSNPTLAANTLNKQIDGKLNSAFSADEKGTLNDIINKSGSGSQQADLAARANSLPEGPAKVAAHQDFLNYKNNIANDAVARKQQGLDPAEGYDNAGNPISKPVNLSAQPDPAVAGSTASADANGAANVGSNAGRNAVAQSAGQVPDAKLPNPSNIGGNVNAPNATGTISNAQDDIQNAAQAASNNVDQGASIVQRGQQLSLSQAQVPAQSGQGSVNGLASSANANNPSAQANLVSQAQQGNADSHAAQNSATNQAQADPSTQNPAAQNSANQSANNAADDAANSANSNPSGATAGANTADEGGKMANTGIDEALETETTLDELAPEAGPIGPLLEAGSMLATLGTGIAAMFEPDKTQKAPAAPPPQASTIQVAKGDLRNMAAAGVGAF
jgi:hypothetical protein